jgi:hypothetical protein
LNTSGFTTLIGGPAVARFIGRGFRSFGQSAMMAVHVATIAGVTIQTQRIFVTHSRTARYQHTAVLHNVGATGAVNFAVAGNLSTMIGGIHRR